MSVPTDIAEGLQELASGHAENVNERLIEEERNRSRHLVSYEMDSDALWTRERSVAVERLRGLADYIAFGSHTQAVFAQRGFDDLQWTCTCQSAGFGDMALTVLQTWEHHLMLGHVLTIQKEPGV